MARTREEAEAQLRELSRGAVHLVEPKELLGLLMKKEKLVVKAGFDPTRPDLHLGHTVLMNKMRQFQELGHEVVFVVGDFTARIGDPSGRNVTRKVPTEAEIAEGARSYAEQAFKILDRDRTRVVYNGEWLGKMTFVDVIKLAGRYTLARMMERDDFKTRWEGHAPISIHELLYPLAQAQDSVELDCDVELGGTDQLFNLLVGRDVMRELGMRPQCVLTTPILEGTGARVVSGKVVGDKMSKSLDNYVGVSEPPRDQFKKLMKIDDSLLPRYLELLRPDRPDPASDDPRTAKLEFSGSIVSRYHGAPAAEDARRYWVSTYSLDERPDDTVSETLEVSTGAWAMPGWQRTDAVPLANVLVQVKLASTTSEARRLIEAGAVTVDGEPVTDPKHALPCRPTKDYVIRRPKKRLWATLWVK